MTRSRGGLAAASSSSAEHRTRVRHFRCSLGTEPPDPPTIDFDSPDLRAIEARDQCVAAAGLVRELSCTSLITLGIENPEEDNAARGEPNA